MRLIDSLLLLMDGYRGKSLLIAATNCLDSNGRPGDVLRRPFEEVLFFEQPDREQIRRLIPLKLRTVRWDLPLNNSAFVDQFRGLSHADVERVLLRAVKTMVLQGREHLTRAMVEEALARWRR